MFTIQIKLFSYIDSYFIDCNSLHLNVRLLCSKKCTKTKNVEYAFLGIIAGENGGLIENCTIINSFIEYKCSQENQDEAEYYSRIIYGNDEIVYPEKMCSLESAPIYNGKSTGNSIIINEDFIPDEHYTLVE